MHTVGRKAFRVACRLRLIHSCRVVSGVRHPIPSRNFHRSAVAYRIPTDPTASTTNDTVELGESSDGHRGEENRILEGGRAPGTHTETEPVEGARRGKVRGNYGSATRRTNRNKHNKEVPPFSIPDWFWQKNLKCIERQDQNERPPLFWGAWASPRAQPPMLDGSRAVPLDFDELLRSWGPKQNEIPGNHPEAESERDTSIKKFLESMYPHMKQARISISTRPQNKSIFPKAELKLTGSSRLASDDESDALNDYVVSLDVFSEILASIQACLSLPPPPGVELKAIQRPDLLLQCPREDSSEYLNFIVAYATRLLGADLIVLNPEDLAQIFGGYMGENIAWTWSSTALLGYEADKSENLDEEPSENHDSEDVDEDAMLQRMKASLKAITSSLNPSHSHSRHSKGIVIIGQPKAVSGDRRSMSMEELLNPSSHATAKSDSSADRWANFKLNVAVETLLDSPEIERSSNVSEATEPSEATKPAVQESLDRNEPPLVIQINGYKELLRTEMGNKILKTLRAVIKERWHDGRSIVIVGTSATQDPVPAFSRGEINRLQSDIVYGDHRTIFVPPGRSRAQESLFRRDEKQRIRDLNIRHVEDMLQKLASSKDSSLKIDLKKNLPARSLSSRQTHAGWVIDEYVWDYPRVHRIAVMMLGLRDSSNVLEGPAFAYALDMMFTSDSVKFQWAKSEMEKQKILITENDNADEPIADDDAKAPRDKLKDLRKHLTPHEQSLIGGVVDPESIHTTFADVRAPSETVEALKTLTTLSLIRPEAFSYGVLATDKIPGLLLYGPPGTGKTLLAKAVAKESGATVLEVSGSDLNEMYVGEGEKKVKALFSLAKKLTPCVVFIDEADALFGSRNSDSRRASHRELINQFLREWDGMNDLSAFIMVATNRPFDIDEAILRRLPRRLLVDLPLEADRLAIMKIHLKDEVLDDDVDLPALAKNTPFYSGSDLKNVSVAAALACVRDENEAAVAHPVDSETKFVYPEKRVLAKRHFEKALEEISASINEDMSTLAAIRKFDERYGDRKGRRKKAPKIGFGGPKEADSDAEAGRIRRKVVDM